MEASGRTADVDAYLTWAAGQRLTVVRVLAMAKHLFELPPARGVAALDPFLARAARHGIFVEVVALADTASYELDLRTHMREIGAICGRHSNALVEIANEPYHPTQREEVHEPAYLLRLRVEVPPGVPTSLGTGDDPRILTGGGDYVTVHYPRSNAANGWGWVGALKQGAAHVTQFGKPVVNDEPIGAGERHEPGRRDASPERFRAAALAGRLTGISATFHYQGGLQAQVPQGNELACFRAWQEAWTLIPPAARPRPFEPGADAPVHAVRGDRVQLFAGRDGDAAWVVVAGAAPNVAVEWAPGWRVSARRSWPGSRFEAAARIPR